MLTRSNRQLSFIITVALPGPDAYGKNGWCFSTEHTDLDITGAVPCTQTMGGRYANVLDIYLMETRLHGQLYFNPVANLEPDYSVEYVNLMKEWRSA